MLRPFNFDTLAIAANNYASDERLSWAAAPSLAIVAAGIIPCILLIRGIASATHGANASAPASGGTRCARQLKRRLRRYLRRRLRRSTRTTPDATMEMAQYLGRAVARLRARGLGDVSRYSLHVIKERALASVIDLTFGGRLCRTDLDENIYSNGRHTMVHTDYHVLRDIFARVPLTTDDVLVDVGCGEGRVINFWLSQGWKNPIIGIEVVEAVAERSTEALPQISECLDRDRRRAGEPAAQRNAVLSLQSVPGDEVVAAFEKAIRPLDARIVFHQNNYMEPFESDVWRIEPIHSKGTVYEFKAALISKRRA